MLSQDDLSHDERTKSGAVESPSAIEKQNGEAPVITVHDKKWTDGSIPLNAVSSELGRLGKVNLIIYCAGTINYALASTINIQQLCYNNDKQDHVE